MKYIKFDISSAGLHILAMALMLCDHLWATLIPGNIWLTCIGRLAYPIFAFMTVEGYFHTRNLKKYALRLLLLAVLSEIPFNLMYSGRTINPFHQNVLFTLLLGLLLYHGAERFVRAVSGRLWKTAVVAVLQILGCLLGGLIGFADYGLTGVLVTAMFCCFPRWKYVNLFRIVCLILLLEVFFKGEILLVPAFGTVFEIGKEAMGIFAMIPILLYSGKKGRGGKVMQYIGYGFYPVHMLILHLIRYFM